MIEVLRTMVVDGVVDGVGLSNTAETGEILAAMIAGIVGAGLVLGVGAFVARNSPEL